MKKEAIQDLLSQLRLKAELVGQLNCFIGFDGYVDQIIRIVKSRSSLTEYDLFQKISQFSGYLQENTGKSAGLEMITTEFKLGGNAPIMAYSLARQGVRTVCAGTFGEPELHPAYEEMARACKVVTVGAAAVTYAFEFQDGKLMFGELSGLNNLNWESLKQKVGLDAIVQHCAGSQLIAIVNWSGIFQIESILSGFLDEVFPKLSAIALAEKTIFIDLADPTARTEEDMRMFIGMLKRYSRHVKVVVGLNEKEARMIGMALGIDVDPEAGLQALAESVYAGLDTSILVVHAPRRAVGISSTGTFEADSFYVDNPLISTGAGDNFNGGFCLGQMLELPMEHSLILGNAVSSFYIRNGFSPSWEQLLGYLASDCE
jgi:sugar/nucleoside kinase (ribokinase family)